MGTPPRIDRAGELCLRIIPGVGRCHRVLHAEGDGWRCDAGHGWSATMLPIPDLELAGLEQREPAPGGQIPGTWFGRLLVSSCTQPGGAPLIDVGATVADSASHGAYILRLSLRRKDEPTMGVVLAWRGARAPWGPGQRLRWWRIRTGLAVRRRLATPILRRLLGSELERCDGCGLPLTGVGSYGGEDAEQLCVLCAPMGRDAGAPLIALPHDAP